MMSFLSTPVLVYLGCTLSTSVLFWAYIVGTALTVPLWCLAGYQDAKRHEIDSWICILLLLATVAHGFLFGCVGLGIADMLLAYFTLREKEIELVGQADFVLLAHWVTVPFVLGTGTGVMLLSSVVFLCCLIGYVAVYRDANGKRWHRGKMVPIVPPYTVAVVLLTLYQYPVSIICWKLGW